MANKLKTVLSLCLVAAIVIVAGVLAQSYRKMTVCQVLGTDKLEVIHLRTVGGDSIDISQEASAAIADLVQDAVVRHTPWDTHSLSGNTEYQLELRIPGETLDMVDLRVDDNGETIFYIRNSSNQYKAWRTVSFPEVNDLLAVIDRSVE